MPVPGSITLDPEAIHRLSNHLMVILGFIELMLADTPPGDPRRNDLSEVRSAVVAAAKLIGHSDRTP